MISAEQRLLTAAREAATHAYTPYSGFPVGAALETVDGRLFTGCNIENASFGLSMCAERAAVAQAVTAGCQRFVRIAIVAGTGPEPTLPCGACRQVLAEFASPSLECLLASLDQVDRVHRFTLADLLPHPFTLKPA